MQTTFRSFFNSSAIIDFGSAVTKVDDSREELPQYIFKSIVGRPKYNRLIGDAAENWVINPEIDRMGIFRMSNAIKRGVFQSEDDMRAIMTKAYTDLTYNSNKKPVLYTEPLFTSKAVKKRVLKMGFEAFESESVLFANHCSLALFAYGKTDGLVLESGEGLTQVGAIYGGYKVDTACSKYEFGGSDVSAYLKTSLMENEVSLHTTSEQHLLNDIKQTLCRVPVNSQEYESVARKNQKDLQRVDYKLPDGETLILNEQQLLAGELLFQPTIANLPQLSIPQMITKSIENLEPELQMLFLKNLYISGGNTNFRGFDERLSYELNKGLNPASKRKLCIPKVERSYLVWQGGAVLTNLNSISKIWITAKEFEEQGDRIFLIKSF